MVLHILFQVEDVLAVTLTIKGVQFGRDIIQAFEDSFEAHWATP
jgi:hypothetical protein